IFEFFRKIRADTFVGPPAPGLGGFLPTTRTPGCIVIVTFGFTKVRPSMSTRQPVGHISLCPMVPLRVTRLVHCSPPAPACTAPGGGQAAVTEPPRRGESGGLAGWEA